MAFARAEPTGDGSASIAPRRAMWRLVTASAAALRLPHAQPDGRTSTKTHLVADTVRGINRQYAAASAAAPRQAAALNHQTVLELMEAAGRPQHCGRGRETLPGGPPDAGVGM